MRRYYVYLGEYCKYCFELIELNIENIVENYGYLFDGILMIEDFNDE